jgi:hypothetical protein
MKESPSREREKRVMGFINLSCIRLRGSWQACVAVLYTFGFLRVTAVPEIAIAGEVELDFFGSLPNLY